MFSQGFLSIVVCGGLFFTALACLSLLWMYFSEKTKGELW